MAALNYIFRGDLAVSAPPSRVYAIVDHSTTAGEANLQGYSGFDAVRVRIKNGAEPSQLENEEMGVGTLHARLRFRRNLCYRDDLNGQYGTASFNGACIASSEEAIVSDAITNAEVTAADQDFTFTFGGRQLPINATHVHLQIIYRGPLGQDSDAVVVASLDVSEPSFFTVLNATDYIKINEQVYTRAELASNQALLGVVQPRSCVDTSGQDFVLKDACFQSREVDLQVLFGGAPRPVVNISGFPVRRIVRVAYFSNGMPVDSNFRAPAVSMQLSGCGTLAADILPSLMTSGIDAGSGLPYFLASPAASTIRGTVVTSSLSCVLDGGGNDSGLPAGNLASMSPLTPEERIPLSFQITQQ